MRSAVSVLVALRIQLFPTRRTAALGVALLVIGNVAAAWADRELTLTIARMLCGIGKGLIVAIAFSLAAGSPRPTRAFAVLNITYALFSTFFYLTVPYAIRWEGAAGAFLAMAYIFLQQMFRRGLEDPTEIEQLGVEVYSAIPLSEQQIELSQHRRRLLGKGRSALLALAAPDDVASEAMRSLRTSMRFTQLGASDNRLMVCGSSSQAGKTFVSSNLAAVNAQAGLRVLLIDANMRDGDLHQVLGVRADGGLSELLAGELEVPEAIRPITGLGGELDFIPRGNKPSNPSELLMQPYFGALLRRLSPAYDLVVIDSPPILAVTDAAIIGHHVGTSLLVVRYGLNQSREVELAMQRFRQAGVTIKGVVFNGMEKRSSGFSTYGFLGYGFAQ